MGWSRRCDRWQFIRNCFQLAGVWLLVFQKQKRLSIFQSLDCLPVLALIPHWPPATEVGFRPSFLPSLRSLLRSIHPPTRVSAPASEWMPHEKKIAYLNQALSVYSESTEKH